MWTELFEYLKKEKMYFEFNQRTNEVIIERKYIDFEFRKIIIDMGFNLLECDTLFVIF